MWIPGGSGARVESLILRSDFKMLVHVCRKSPHPNSTRAAPPVGSINVKIKFIEGSCFGEGVGLTIQCPEGVES